MSSEVITFSAAILGSLFELVTVQSSTLPQALLWQQDFSLERNERANVLQVGFIKLRPGTLVVALHNYHVTKPGNRELQTYTYNVEGFNPHACTHTTGKWKNI